MAIHAKAVSRIFGMIFDKSVGGFMRRADEIFASELDVADEFRSVFQVLGAARRDSLSHIKTLDSKVRAVAHRL